jgi:hypothetical protein
MVCDLSPDALAVLHKLVWTRAVSEKSSRSVLRIRRDLPDSIDVDAALHELENARLVGRKKKNAINYWVSLGEAQRILEAHGYKVRRGGRFPL